MSSILFCIGLCVSYNVAVEIVGQYMVYSNEEYSELQEKARNLGRRLKLLKYEYLYIPSNKKKQEGKMIAV